MDKVRISPADAILALFRAERGNVTGEASQLENLTKKR